MKSCSRFAALALAVVLMVGLALPAAAMTIQVGDTSIQIKDEIAQDPAFQAGLEKLFQQLDPAQNQAAFLEALDELTLTVVNAQMGVDHEQVKAEEAVGQYKFDRGTGTIIKVISASGATLILPVEIDGVAVTAIAPGAIDGLDIRSVVFLHNFEQLGGIIIRNCPKLKVINTAPTTKVLGRLYENCPLLGQEALAGAYFEQELMGRTNLPQSLLTAAKIFRGDNRGDQNWSGQLTRAEAATLILRLTGDEASALAVQSQPSPFSDVPDWANGYVNYAHQTGMVKGVGEDRFDPSGLCGAKEFSLMLLRLTQYREGSDYAWATAVEDIQRLIGQGRALTGKTDLDGGLFSQLYNGGSFTREYACALIYRMLSAPTGGAGMESLGDTLCAEGALSGTLLLEHGVRLTPRALGGKNLSLYLTDSASPDTITLLGNRLKVDLAGDYEVKLFTAPVEGGGYEPASDNDVLTLTGPVRLSLQLTQTTGNFSTDFTALEVRQAPDGELYLQMNPVYLATAIIHRDTIVKEAALAKAKGQPATAAVQTLAEQLTAGKSGDYAKAKAISAWVAENITYDYATRDVLEGNRWDTATGQSRPVGGLTAAAQDANTVLSTKTGVCAGYANLTAALMNAAGVPCVTVSSSIANHAWNQVYVNGRWISLDNTWDSGQEQYWFDLPTHQFLLTHPIGDLPGRETPRSTYYS